MSDVVYWVLFFGLTVYGHVAMKFAVMETDRSFVSQMFTGFGLTALMAWFLSALLWGVLLSRYSLFEACSASSIRYLCVSLSAWLLLGETLSILQFMGMGFIVIGIYFVVA